MVLLYPDELLYGYLRPLYTPYRAGLGDPTVLPLEADVMWNFFAGGVKDTSFIVAEDYQQPQRFNLGASAANWQASSTIYVITLWTKDGKPQYLKQFANFLEKYLVVKGGIPAGLQSTGLNDMRVTQFATTQGLTNFHGYGTFSNIQNPETDWWVLSVNVQTKYMSPAN
jgi:hypothetical protein